MTKLVLKKFGEISGGDVEEIVAVIEECYERLMFHEVEILDLLLFKNSSAMKDFYSSESSAMGVISEELGEQFFAGHDAWRGTSRIAVCLERMKRLPKQVQLGILRHEVGHSVLHGSMEYYVFSITPPLAVASARFGISRQFSLDILYLISIAVKDFEVTRVLLDRGYVDDQIAYIKHVLSTSNEDLDAWQIAEGNHAGMALCLAGRLKDVTPAIALCSKLGEPEMAKWMNDELSYLPEKVLTNMSNFLQKFLLKATGNTFEKVDVAMKIFIEDLLEPLFK